MSLLRTPAARYCINVFNLSIVIFELAIIPLLNMLFGGQYYEFLKKLQSHRVTLLRRSGTIYSDATVLFHPTQRYDFADVITFCLRKRPRQVYPKSDDDISNDLEALEGDCVPTPKKIAAIYPN